MSRKPAPTPPAPHEAEQHGGSRTGTRILSAHVDEAIFRAFKLLAAENLATTDIMLHKAVALLLEHFGKPLPGSLWKKLSIHGLSGEIPKEVTDSPARPSIKPKPIAATSPRRGR
jgi:hypothetical protein